ASSVKKQRILPAYLVTIKKWDRISMANLLKNFLSCFLFMALKRRCGNIYYCMNSFFISSSVSHKCIDRISVIRLHFFIPDVLTHSDAEIQIIQDIKIRWLSRFKIPGLIKNIVRWQQLFSGPKNNLPFSSYNC